MTSDLRHLVPLLLDFAGTGCVTAVIITALAAWLLWQDPENRPTPPDPDHEEDR